MPKTAAKKSKKWGPDSKGPDGQTNRQRADRLKTYIQANVAYSGGDFETAITDLLADLMHCADIKLSANFDDLVECARANYEAEKRGEF